MIYINIHWASFLNSAKSSLSVTDSSILLSRLQSFDIFLNSVLPIPRSSSIKLGVHFDSLWSFNSHVSLKWPPLLVYVSSIFFDIPTGSQKLNVYISTSNPFSLWLCWCCIRSSAPPTTVESHLFYPKPLSPFLLLYSQIWLHLLCIWALGDLKYVFCSTCAVLFFLASPVLLPIFDPFYTWILSSIPPIPPSHVTPLSFGLFSLIGQSNTWTNSFIKSSSTLSSFRTAVVRFIFLLAFPLNSLN